MTTSLEIKNHLKDWAENFLPEILIDNESWDVDILDNKFHITWSKDHEGGLEGFYCDTYTGYIEAEDEELVAEFELIDVFCSEGKWTFELVEDEEETQQIVNQKEEIKDMTAITDFVTIILVDNDENLPSDKRMIAKFEDVVIPSGEEQSMTMMKLCMNRDVKEKIEAHNKIREEIPNPKTLERTGNKVPLQPIDLDQVTVMFK